MSVDITKLNRQKLDSLGAYLKSDFSQNEIQRKEKEQEWLESLRQIKQVYDPEALAKMDTEEPKIYPGYTRSKTVPLKAKLVQNLIPSTKDLNWDIKPSPIPSIDQDTLDYIVTSLCAAMKVTPDMLTEQVIEEGIRAMTEERANAMKITIKDQLLDDKYTERQKEAISSGVDYGTGIIKGALSEPYSYTKLKKTSDPLTGIVIWTQERKEHYRPSSECVSIWNFFPDMSAISKDKCRFIDTLRSEIKHDVKKLAEREDFFGDIIEEYLRLHPKGDYKLRDWEMQAQTTGSHNTQPSRYSENYEIVDRDCYLDGWQLFEMGISEEVNINESYFVNVWLLGDKIIKITQWNKDLCKNIEDLYHIFYYEKDETSIFGTGLPKIIRYEQLGLAACDRNMLRNAAWIAGPCGEVNINLLHPSMVKDANKIFPGKFYVKDVRGSDANSKVLSIYDIESRATEFLAIKNDLRMQGDSDSSLPSYLFGDTQRSGETPLGTAKMQFASMIDFIKNLAGNFDSMHKSYLASVIRWNMAFNPDERIKGDLQVETIGSAAAIINEAIVSQMAFLVQSLPDEAKARIKWDVWLKEIFKLTLPEYEKMIKTEEEYMKEVEARIQEQERTLQIQEGLANAKIDKDTASAEKTRIASNKIATEIPHAIAGKAIDNEAKQVESASKIIDMQEKKNAMNTQDIDNFLKITEAMRGQNEPA